MDVVSVTEKQLSEAALQVAQEYEEHPETWCSDSFGEDIFGVPVKFNDPTAVKGCVLGRIYKKLTSEKFGFFPCDDFLVEKNGSVRSFLTKKGETVYPKEFIPFCSDIASFSNRKGPAKTAELLRKIFT